MIRFFNDSIYETISPIVLSVLVESGRYFFKITSEGIVSVAPLDSGVPRISSRGVLKLFLADIAEKKSRATPRKADARGGTPTLFFPERHLR